MNTPERTQEKFKDASGRKDLDMMQELLLSEDGGKINFHKEIWKLATDYCSEKETAKAYRVFRSKINHRKASRWAIPTILSAAAVCCLLAVNIWMNVRNTPGLSETEWTECMAHNCEIKDLILADSTHVWLNARSRIIYPERFSGKERKVFVEGEAYFEVKQDSLHPFVVQSGEHKVKVTGTKFNLKSYNDRFSATLVEGGINILLYGNEYSMVPGEVIRADPNTGLVHKAGISCEEYPNWYRGELNICDESLKEIAEDLERKFGTKIIIRNKTLEEERFTFNFINNESLDEILDAMSIMNSMQIIRTDNIVDIL